jgi:hypothetical protein
MVEIKRTRAGQSFLNRPIGVVNVRTGSERVAQAEADMFKSISDASFQTAMSMQRSEAAEYLKTVNVMDDEGKLKVVQIPKGLGKYGNEAVSQELSRRYKIGFENELRQVLPELKMQAQGKPEKLQELFGDYLKTRTDLIKKTGGEDDIPALREIANTLGSAAYNDMRISNIDAQNKRSIMELQANVENAAEDILQLAASGNSDGASTRMLNMKGEINSDPLLGEEDKVRLIDSLEASMNKGKVSRSLQGKSSVELNRIAIELEQGVLSDETRKTSPQLLDIPASEYSTIARTFRTQSGRVSVQEELESKIASAKQRIKDGGATQEDIDLAQSSGQLTRDLILENDMLPTSTKNVITTSFSNPVDKTDEQQVQRLVQAVMDFSNYRTEQTDVGVVKKTMGLDDLTLVRGDYLLSQFNSRGEAGLVEAVNKLNVDMADQDFTFNVRNKMFGSDKKPKKGDTVFTLAIEFENKHLPNTPPSLRNEMRPILIEAFKTSETPSQALQQYNDVKDMLFKSSPYFEDGVVSRYAPEVIATRSGVNEGEKAFTELFAEKRRPLDDTDEFKYKNMFERSVDKFIHAHPDFKDKSITKNIKLRPINRRSDQTKASYYLYDSNTGEVLYGRNGPLVYNTDRLKNQKEMIRIAREADRQKRQEEAKGKKTINEVVTERLEQNISLRQQSMFGQF